MLTRIATGIHSNMYTPPSARIRTTLVYIVSYGVWLAVSLRGISIYFNVGHPQRWVIVALLVIFGLLMGTERWICKLRYWYWYAHLYLIIQTVIVASLSLFSIPLDFFSALFFLLSGVAVLFFPRRVGYSWVALFTLVTTGSLIYQYGLVIALPLLLFYTAGYFFVSAYANAINEADTARDESERLLSELRRAHKQLQDYAKQVEELAVLKERNRLARELHDSVTQTLYGATLETETAIRQLKAGKQEEALMVLHELQQDGQQALQEMRLLIYELRPPILEKEGLVLALKSRLEMVGAKAGIEVEFHSDWPRSLPKDMEEGLYRIAQEALNNVVKHSQASRVILNLSHANNRFSMEIKDDGIGFDVSRSNSAEGYGIGVQGMRERAANIRGTLKLTGLLGKGTSVEVEVQP